MSAKHENAIFPSVCKKPSWIPINRSRPENIIALFQHEEDDPAWMQSSILTDSTREVGLPLHEILAITDLMREAYADGNLDSLQKLLSLLSLKTAIYASSVGSLIEAAKYKTASMDLAVEIIDLIPLMQEVAQATRTFLGNKPITIMEVASSSPTWIRSDRAKIKQIIMGLMNNAAKFTDRGRISLIASRDDDSIRLTVTDTGIGMTTEHVKNLFAPADMDSQASAKNSFERESGVRIVMNLVMLLKGKISASSKLGKGTIIEVSLPQKLPDTPPQSHICNPKTHRGPS